MKTIVLVVAVILSTSPLFAAIPSPKRPSQAILNVPVNIPVLVSGKQSGSVTVNKGTLVTIAHVRRDRLQIDFQGSQAWVKRSDTDFDQRLKDFRQTKQAAQAQVQKAVVTQNQMAQKQDAKARANFDQQHNHYSNPLDKGPYDQQRSVVDYYDWLGRRYHIGVFGQRIYD
jgi:hypothetical protein